MRHDPATLRDLVSARTIATRLGVTRSAVTMWRARDENFPAPLDVPGVSVPLYSWSEVAAWRGVDHDDDERDEDDA